MSFDLPCSLTPVDAVLMFTGNSVIWYCNVSLMSLKLVGLTVTVTSFCSGDKNTLQWRKYVGKVDK